MKVRAEHFKKAGSTNSDVPIETLMICTYCRKKHLSDNKNKDPETFVPSMQQKNLTKSVYPWRYFLSGRKLKLPFWKWKQKCCKSLLCGSMVKRLTSDVLLKKMALKVSQNSNISNRVSFYIKLQTTGTRVFVAVNFKKFLKHLFCRTPANNKSILLRVIKNLKMFCFSCPTGQVLKKVYKLHHWCMYTRFIALVIF